MTHSSKNRFLSALIALLLLSATIITGCVQLPTEKQGVSDLRPQISFVAESEKAKNSQVIIDGLNMGIVGSYLSGTAGLRLLPGSHIISVMYGNEILLNEKFYVGDGVSQTFNVK